MQYKLFNVVHINCATRQDTQKIVNIRDEYEIVDAPCVDDAKTKMENNMASNFEVVFEGEKEPRRSPSITHLPAVQCCARNTLLCRSAFTINM